MPAGLIGVRSALLGPPALLRCQLEGMPCGVARTAVWAQGSIDGFEMRAVTRGTWALLVVPFLRMLVT